ncbi:MAG: tetratricopeptide repeat protein [Elusimicrobia bacterium]|nr:tetratricopeptide repeat protein [Elusimicrobiota bacterium]
MTRNNRWLGLAVAAAACGVFFNSLGGGFVQDDRPIIAENPLVRGPLSLAGIFGSSYWQRGEPSRTTSRPPGGEYRPFSILSYALNQRISGWDPFWFHLVNIGLHAAACLLLFLVSQMLGFPAGASFLGALAFAVLPVHVEAVSSIVGRAEVLGTVFVLTAWLVLHEEGRWPRIAAGIVFYGLALLSKESAAPFPAVLVLGEAYRCRGRWKGLVQRRLLPWLSVFGALALYLAWRKAILGSALHVAGPYFPTQSTPVVWLTMAKFLFRGWLWPMASGLGLCAEHGRPAFPDAGVSDPAAWLSLALAGGVAAWAFRSFLRGRASWAFSALVFFCLAAPLSNLLVPMGIIGAERIEYLPSIGFCLLLSCLWGAAARRSSPSWSKALAAGCLIWWACLTVEHNRAWRDDASFYTSAASCAPGHPRVLSGLGMVADLAGRRAEARDLYRQALAIDPDLAGAAYNMGKSLYDDGDWRGAKAWFHGLESRSRADKDTLCFLGLIAEREGRSREALAYYGRALERDPAYPDARRNLGLLLYRMGDARNAAGQLREYLRVSGPSKDTRDVSAFLEGLEPRPRASSAIP